LFEAVSSRLTKLQDVLAFFLDSTVTVTVENSASVKEKAQEAKQEALGLLASSVQVALEENNEAHASMLDSVVGCFNKELEGHQGRMSRRLLEARDVMGDKLIAMRQGKELQVGHALTLERQVLVGVVVVVVVMRC
jgi:hypothetical protein